MSLVWGGWKEAKFPVGSKVESGVNLCFVFVP